MISIQDLCGIFVFRYRYFCFVIPTYMIVWLSLVDSSRHPGRAHTGGRRAGQPAGQPARNSVKDNPQGQPAGQPARTTRKDSPQGQPANRRARTTLRLREVHCHRVSSTSSRTHGPLGFPGPSSLMATRPRYLRAAHSQSSASPPPTN